MKTITHTLDEEITEMKEKYQQSIEGESSAKLAIKGYEQTLKMAQSAIQSMTVKVAVACTDLKKICRGYNLVNEIGLTMEQMEMEAKLLTSYEARKTAEDMIKVVKSISETLSDKDTLMENNSSSSINTDPVIDQSSIGHGMSSMSISE
eukprot:gene15450-18330_t